MPEHGSTYTIEPEKSDPPFFGLFVVGTVSALLLVVIVLLLETLFHTTARAEWERKVVAAEPEKLMLLEAGQREQLNGYRPVDAAAGTTTMPIERAMELVVDEARASGGRVDPR